MQNVVEFHPIAILIATAVGYGLGALWYMPAIFGNRWMRALNKAPEQLGSPARAMLLNFFSTLLTALVLDYLLGITGANGVWEGLVVSLVAAIGLLGTSQYGDHLFANTPISLLLISTGYRVVQIALMGAILGAW